MSVTKHAASRARYKHWKSLLTNWGYGLMAAAGLQSFLATPPITPTSRQVITFVIGVSLQMVATAMAPYGE